MSCFTRSNRALCDHFLKTSRRLSNYMRVKDDLSSWNLTTIALCPSILNAVMWCPWILETPMSVHGYWKLQCQSKDSGNRHYVFVFAVWASCRGHCRSNYKSFKIVKCAVVQNRNPFRRSAYQGLGLKHTWIKPIHFKIYIGIPLRKELMRNREIHLFCWFVVARFSRSCKWANFTDFSMSDSFLPIFVVLASIANATNWMAALFTNSFALVRILLYDTQVNVSYDKNSVYF